jgi:hypothetical protein
VRLDLADHRAQMGVAGLRIVDASARLPHGGIEDFLLCLRVEVQLLHDRVEQVLAARRVVERRPRESQEKIAHGAVITREQLGRPHG